MDDEQFEACWHAHIRRVVAYAERHVGRDASSYDIAASTFLTAWRTWESITLEPLPWLISVARGHVRTITAPSAGAELWISVLPCWTRRRSQELM